MCAVGKGENQPVNQHSLDRVVANVSLCHRKPVVNMYMYAERTDADQPVKLNSLVGVYADPKI